MCCQCVNVVCVPVLVSASALEQKFMKKIEYDPEDFLTRTVGRDYFIALFNVNRNIDRKLINMAVELDCTAELIVDDPHFESYNFEKVRWRRIVPHI